MRGVSLTIGLGEFVAGHGCERGVGVDVSDNILGCPIGPTPGATLEGGEASGDMRKGAALHSKPEDRPSSFRGFKPAGAHDRPRKH